MAKTPVKQPRKAVAKAARKKSPSRKASSTKSLPKVRENDQGKPEVCDGATIEEWLKAAMAATGTNDKVLARRFLSDVMRTFPGNPDDRAKSLNTGLALMHGIGPRDAVEGMMACQMVGLHAATMQCLQRLALDGQTVGSADLNITWATRLVKTLNSLVETLTRYRNQGGQRVKVEHVHVHQGGQAVVGDIHHRGGGGNGGNDQ